MAQELNSIDYRRLTTELVDILIAKDRLSYLKFWWVVNKAYGRDNYNSIRNRAFEYLELDYNSEVFKHDEC